MGPVASPTDGSDAGRGIVAALATQVGFALAVVGMAAVGFIFPGLFTWQWQGLEPRHAIVPLVQLTMLGMGLTLTAADFRRVLGTPVVVALGAACQFGIMPLTGWACTRLFGLTGEVAAGLILVGSCPGGVASNVIAYVARANVPLSVTLTACSTLLAPVTTPLAMRLLADREVPIDAGGMFWSILWVILAPVAAGLAVNQVSPAVARKLARALPVGRRLTRRPHPNATEAHAHPHALGKVGSLQERIEEGRDAVLQGIGRGEIARRHRVVEGPREFRRRAARGVGAPLAADEQHWHQGRIPAGQEQEVGPDRPHRRDQTDHVRDIAGRILDPDHPRKLLGQPPHRGHVDRRGEGRNVGERDIDRALADHLPEIGIHALRRELVVEGGHDGDRPAAGLQAVLAGPDRLSHVGLGRLVDPPSVIERHHVGRKDSPNRAGGYAATPRGSW